MSRWTMGEAEIEKLLAERQLQHVTGAQANGEHLLRRAARTLSTASDIIDDDPDSAYILAYDAARYAGTAPLAQQGLRPTTSGGHYAVELALQSQFGKEFRPFGATRRRRNELEYPSGPGETTSPQGSPRGHRVHPAAVRRGQPATSHARALLSTRTFVVRCEASRGLHDHALTPAPTALMARSGVVKKVKKVGVWPWCLARPPVGFVEIPGSGR